jgi:hypothetical protein
MGSSASLRRLGGTATEIKRRPRRDLGERGRDRRPLGHPVGRRRDRRPIVAMACIVPKPACGPAVH